MDIFTIEQVTTHIKRINTPYDVCAYLVVGTIGTALLDTGMGSGDLKGYLASIGYEPDIVLLSHGHCDHAGGSAQFDEVYLSPRDFELEKIHCSLDYRIDTMKQMNFPNQEVWEPAMIPSRTAPFKPLVEGMSFQLGGVTIETIPVPGHSQGMMVFLIPEDEVAIYGDACGENTLVIFPESTSIQEFYEALKELKWYDGRYTRILRNHGTFESGMALLDNNLKTTEKILAGTDDKVPAVIHGVACFAGKDREKAVADPNDLIGNVLYTEDKL